MGGDEMVGRNGFLRGNKRGWSRSFRAIMRKRFLLEVVCLLACAYARAQTTGSLLGVLTDQNGAVIPSATVRVTNTDTGFTASTVSNAQGSYLVPLLPIGHYSIAVTASGFKSYTQSNVLVPVAQDIRVDVKLEIGQVAQTVTVNGNAINIDTTTATLGETVDNARLEDLPLNGRNAADLLGLLPGVADVSAPVYQTGARGGPSFSIAGSRTDFGNMQLDGTTITDALSNSNQNLPNPDALSEFRVLTDSFGAEYGRAGGGVILAVTKSGTNQFHGGAWEYLRNNAFDANVKLVPAGTPKSLLRYDQFGGDFGGPVILPKYNGKNRTFFFVNYEGIRIHQESLTTTFVPTAAETTGDFSALLPSQVLTDPNTRLPYPGNIIPTNELDPVAIKYNAAFVPLPNQPNGELQHLQAGPSNVNQLIIKADQTFGSRDRMWFRLFRNKAITTGPNPIPFFTTPSGYQYQSYAADEIHTFSPNVINEFEASYSRPEGLPFTTENGQSPSQLGINSNGFTPYPQTPDMSVSGAFSAGSGWYVDEPSYFREFEDKVSWLHGKHDIVAGMNFNAESNGDLAYPPMTWSFSGQYTGSALADYMIGRPNGFSVNTTIVDHGRSKLFQPFFQDTFKVTKQFTLDLGLRYYYQTPWTQSSPGGASTYVTSQQQSTVFPTAPPGLVAPGDKGVPPGLYFPWKLGFEPRIGLAWDVTGNGTTSVRAAWGVFHPVVDEEVEAIETNNEPYLVTFSDTPPNTENPWAGLTDPLPYNPKNPSFGPFPGETQSYVDPNFRPAEIQQFNLNVQHRFGADLFADVAYVGTVSQHMYDATDLNPATYIRGNDASGNPLSTEANAQSRRPILPQYYGSIPALFDDADAAYHSLQVEVQKRISHNYSVQAAYTWEKSIDDHSGSLIGPPPYGPQNPTDLKADRGLSDFNVGQIFVVNALWDLPALTGKGVLTAVAGGWKLTTIVGWSGGNPQTVYTGVDNALLGYCRALTGGERADLIGDSSLAGGRSRAAREAEYFNTAAFAQPGPGQFGTLGRNTIINPGNLQDDVSVMKKLYTLPHEFGGFQFRVDYFNVLNRTNLSGPQTTMTSSAFGQILSAGPQRIGQVALRYDF
jgi:carboxypeptidase family protein/TonB-dependent receptor-like protein